MESSSGSGSLGDGNGSAEPPSAEDYEEIKRSLRLTPKAKAKSFSGHTKVPEPAPDPVPELVEELVEVEQWARANLHVLRLREGDCFKTKLRQLNGDEEKRFYLLLTKHQKRIEASEALVAQLAKLDCMVMNQGDTDLHTPVPSAASGSTRVRNPTDAGLNAQEEDKKRPKTDATWRYTVNNTGSMASAVSQSRSSIVYACNAPHVFLSVF